MAGGVARLRAAAVVGAALICVMVQADAGVDHAQERTSRQNWCLSFHEVHPSMTPAEAQRRGVPAGYRVYPSDVTGNDLLLRAEPALHGGDMADAQTGFDAHTGLPVVTFRFNAAGAAKFAAFTRNNIGRPFAVVVDGSVVTAPVIREPILGGMGQISGNFTPAGAAQLAARIRAGTCADLSRVPADRLSGTT